MAYAYTVSGSEDGVFAVVGSKKKALIKAAEYLSNSDDEVVNVVNSGKYHTAVHGDRVSIDIERFWME